MKTLVVGNGMLGQAIGQHVGAAGEVLRGIPWAEPAAARGRITEGVHRFIAQGDEPARLLCWCAGAGVVGTPERPLDVERAHLEGFLDAVASAPSIRPELVRVFVASSAGGVYAAGDGAECDESTPPSPRSAYGLNKLRQDEVVKAWSDSTGVPALIGRISNLYGPQQNLAKPQGFISHLCRAIARRSPFTLSVPAGTVRDFVYTDDVAARIVLWASTGEQHLDPGATTKLLVSGRSITLGQVIARVRAISRAPTRILLGSRPGDAEQPAALRFRSRVATYLDETVPNRTIEHGIRVTWLSAMRSLQAGNTTILVHPVEDIAGGLGARPYTPGP